MGFKEIKKELGIGNKDIADAFGYKSVGSFNTSRKSKKLIEEGLSWFYDRVKSGTKSVKS